MAVVDFCQQPWLVARLMTHKEQIIHTCSKLGLPGRENAAEVQTRDEMLMRTMYGPSPYTMNRLILGNSIHKDLVPEMTV